VLWQVAKIVQPRRRAEARRLHNSGSHATPDIAT